MSSDFVENLEKSLAGDHRLTSSQRRLVSRYMRHYENVFFNNEKGWIGPWVVCDGDAGLRAGVASAGLTSMEICTMRWIERMITGTRCAERTMCFVAFNQFNIDSDSVVAFQELFTRHKYIIETVVRNETNHRLIKLIRALERNPIAAWDDVMRSWETSPTSVNGEIKKQYKSGFDAIEMPFTAAGSRVFWLISHHALDVESAMMWHCVGHGHYDNHLPDFPPERAGDLIKHFDGCIHAIFRVADANMKPIATIEVGCDISHGSVEIGQARGRMNAEIDQEIVRDFLMNLRKFVQPASDIRWAKIRQRALMLDKYALQI